MKLFNELEKALEIRDYSIELIDYCKGIFQLGGWSDDDFNDFSKSFYNKSKESCPILTDEQIQQILRVIYHCGVLRLEDILFIDGAAFTSQGRTNTWGNGEYTSAYRIDFFGPSKKYKDIDFLETTHFFYYHLYVSKKLNENIVPILPQLRDEINNIFVNYFNNRCFPEKLATYSAHCFNYVISCNEEEIISGLNNKVPFDISIICRVENESKVIKLDINCNLNSEKFLTVTSVDDNVEKLSTIIAQSKINNEYDKGRVKLPK